MSDQFHHLRRRSVGALSPSDATLDRIAARVRDDIDSHSIANRERPLAATRPRDAGVALVEGSTARRRRRVVVLAVVAVFCVTGVAVANGDAIREAFSPNTPASDRMEVFRKAPTISAKPDALSDPKQPIVPADVQARFDLNWKIEPEFMARQYGQQKGGPSARVLLDHHGDWDVAIYAVPTTRGACFEVSEAGRPGSSACIAGFTQKAPISIGVSSSGYRGKQVRQQIHGLAADEVTAVAVQLADGTEEPALMGDNAYVWHDESGAKKPIRLVVTLEGGARTEVAYPFAAR